VRGGQGTWDRKTYSKNAAEKNNLQAGIRGGGIRPPRKAVNAERCGRRKNDDKISRGRRNSDQALGLCVVRGGRIKGEVHRVSGKRKLERGKPEGGEQG